MLGNIGLIELLSQARMTMRVVGIMLDEMGYMMEVAAETLAQRQEAPEEEQEEDQPRKSHKDEGNDKEDEEGDPNAVKEEGEHSREEEAGKEDAKIEASQKK